MADVTPKPKLQGIEAARGVAAALVVIYHAARHLDQAGFGLPAFGGIERFGHAGVDFFFVLSGFIILLVHWNDVGGSSALRNYVQRRVTRIYPMYWFVLALYLGNLLVGPRADTLEAPRVIANVALYPIASNPIVGVAWTLEHEVLFYAIFGLAILDRRLGALALILWMGCVGSVMAGLIETPTTGIANTISSAYNVQFVMGMMAAVVARRARTPIPLAWAVLGAAAFTITGIAESHGAIDGYANPARFAYGAAALLLVVGLAEGERAIGPRIPRVMGELGKASYSIYLSHLLVIGASYKALDTMGFVAMLPTWALHLLLTVIGIVGGIVLSYLVEYPMMRLLRRHLHRSPGA